MTVDQIILQPGKGKPAISVGVKKVGGGLGICSVRWGSRAETGRFVKEGGGLGNSVR